MKMLKINKYLLRSLLAVGLLLIIFIGVNPQDKPLGIVFVPVVLSWLFLYLLGRWLLSLIATPHEKLLQGIVTVIVSLVVLMIMLSGIGQLKLIDIILITSLAAVSTFYLYRMWG